MLYPHCGHGVTRYNETIYVFGGLGDSKTIAEEYDMVENTWKRLPD
jgi:hypothetical protein